MAAFSSANNWSRINLLSFRSDLHRSGQRAKPMPREASSVYEYAAVRWRIIIHGAKDNMVAQMF